MMGSSFLNLTTPLEPPTVSRGPRSALAGREAISRQRHLNYPSFIAGRTQLQHQRAKPHYLARLRETVLQTRRSWRLLVHVLSAPPRWNNERIDTYREARREQT